MWKSRACSKSHTLCADFYGMHWTRGTRHFLFWTVFFLSALFHEIYFSASFSQGWDWVLFWKTVLSQGLLFVIKAAVVYYSIDVLIPAWSSRQTVALTSSFTRPDRSNTMYLVRFVIVLLIGALLMRLMIQFVIWAHIFDEERHTLSFTSQLARYFYSLFDLIPVAVTAVAVKLMQLRVRALKQESVLVQDKLKSELLYLKSQTNPHFLFNTLNSIYALSRKQDPNTPEAILHLSKILRHMLYEPVQRTNPIRKETDLIRDYIALQKLRFREHIRVVFHVDIDDDDQPVSPLLLLPLVENAFKHSNDAQMDIRISLAVKDGRLDVSVSNSLSDHPVYESEANTGIGLSNMKRQLAILYANHQFTAQPEAGRFEVNLQIDLTSLIHV